MARYSIYENRNGKHYYKTDMPTRELAFMYAVDLVTDGDFKDGPVIKWGDGECYILRQKLKKGKAGNNADDYKYEVFVDVYDSEYTGDKKISENAIYELNPHNGKFIKKVKSNAYPSAKTPAKPKPTAKAKNTNDWLIYGKKKGAKKFKVFTGTDLSDKLFYGLRWPYDKGDKVLEIVAELNRDNPDYTFVRRRGTSSLFGN